jgi:hypothetical protein
VGRGTFVQTPWPHAQSQPSRLQSSAQEWNEQVRCEHAHVSFFTNLISIGVMA